MHLIYDDTERTSLRDRLRMSEDLRTRLVRLLASTQQSLPTLPPAPARRPETEAGIPLRIGRSTSLADTGTHGQSK